MRFNLLSLLLFIAVVALALALLLNRKPDKLILIGGDIETWELSEPTGAEILWADKSEPPRLAISDAYQISESICAHLNSYKLKTGVGFWTTDAVSLNLLGEQRWAYFVRIQGTDYPNHPGQNIVEQITCMIMFNGSVVFDSGSCPDEVRDFLMAFPDIVDAAPVINGRSAREGGVF